MSLEEVFKSFCAFGAGKDGGVAMMDNGKFAKLARDLKLLDKKLTATDVDIIFNRTEVKPKTARKITFQQFKVAVKLMAEKKYPGEADGPEKLENKITSSKGPKTAGTTKAVKGGAVDRLTDTSKYTGSHKERFDESGKGKGADGRYDFDKKAAEGYVGGYKDMGTYDQKVQQE